MKELYGYMYDQCQIPDEMNCLKKLSVLHVKLHFSVIVKQ